MAAIARIRFRLSDGEFWRLTPRQFHSYAVEWSECERRKWDRTRFLATATARAMGQDVDYTEDPVEPEPDEDRFRAWLDRHRVPVEEKADGEGDAGGGDTGGDSGTP